MIGEMTEPRLRLAIEKVSEAMKTLKNDSFQEQFPIGLIDIHLWEWPQGVGLYGLLQHALDSGNKKELDFLYAWYDRQLKQGLPEKNVNTMSPMNALMTLAELSGKPEYITVCEEWSRWIMEEMIRTGDGAFQHMITGDPNPDQILIDTLFMTVLFLAKAGIYFQRPEYVEEAKHQFLVHIKYLYDVQSGLFYHGWDFAGRHHYGGVRWARGNGWYTSGIVDFLDIVSVEPALKQYLLTTFRTQVEALAGLQREDGLWHTILDDAASYPETSATAAFGYGILRGIRKGYLDPAFERTGLAALQAVLQQIDEHGIVHGVSYGTPVGNDAQFYKDIPQCPMTYGQALTLMLLNEGLAYLQRKS